MKKLTIFIFMLLSSVILCTYAPKISAEAYMSDGLDFFSESEEIFLTDLMEEASASTSWNYAIVTSGNNMPIKSAAKSAYESKFDFGSDGVILYIGKNNILIGISGNAKEYLKGSRLSKLEKKTISLFKKSEYLSAAKNFIETSQKYYNSGSSSADFTFEGIFGAVTFFIAATMLCIFLISKSYTTYAKPATNNYLDKRSLDVYRRTDTFIREYITKSK